MFISIKPSHIHTRHTHPTRREEKKTNWWPTRLHFLSAWVIDRRSNLACSSRWMILRPDRKLRYLLSRRWPAVLGLHVLTSYYMPSLKFGWEFLESIQHGITLEREDHFYFTPALFIKHLFEYPLALWESSNRESYTTSTVHCSEESPSFSQIPMENN